MRSQHLITLCGCTPCQNFAYLAEDTTQKCDDCNQTIDELMVWCSHPAEATNDDDQRFHLQCRKCLHILFPDKAP